MKKILLLLTILFFAALNSFAQSDNTNPKIGVGFDFGVVTGPASSLYVATGGLTLKLEVPVVKPLSIIFKTGYTGYISSNGYSTGYYYNSYDGSDSYSNGSIASFVPLETGAKVYVSQRLFLEGDIGASINIGSGGDYYYPAKKVALIYAPNIGYTIPFGSSRASVDISLRYESRVETNSPYSQVAFGAVFNFGLQK